MSCVKNGGKRDLIYLWDLLVDGYTYMGIWSEVLYGPGWEESDPNADWNDSTIFNYLALRQIEFIPRDAVLVMLMLALPVLILQSILPLRWFWHNLLPLYALLVYVRLFHAATHAEVRLSEPFQPFLLILIPRAIIERTKTLLGRVHQ